MAENRLFFLRIVLKSIINSKMRSVVMFFSILFGALITAAFINLYADIDKKVTSELNNYGANVVFSPQNQNQTYIKEQNLDKILENFENLKAQNRYLFGVANIGVSNAVIMGLEFENLRKLMPFLDLKSGEFVTNAYDQSALIGADLAKIIGAGVGDILEIISPANEIYKVRLKGIVFDGQKEDNILIISLNLAQEIFAKSGLVNYANAIIDGDFKSVENSVKSANGGEIKAEIIGKVSKAQGEILDKITLLMLLIGTTMLIITSVGINTTLSSILFSKVKEFALLRSLGSSKMELLKLILSEVIILCLLGSILGSILGYIFAIFLGQIIFSSGVDFRFISLILAVLISLIFALLASFYPIKKALNPNIASLLKE